MSRGGGWATPGLAAYMALLLAAAALFQLDPGIDLAVSGLFYRPGHGFPLDAWEPVVVLVAAIPWIVGAIVVIVAAGAIRLAWSGRKLWRLDARALVFVVLSTALGPGLIANTLLKDHWGRARPVQIALFGGSHHFTAALVPSGECLRNCSFVSGHAAAGFALVAFALLLPRGRRRVWAQAVALSFGALVGLARIAEGGHFLSDVVFAGLLVYAVAWLLHAWIVEHDGLALPPRHAATAATVAGVAALVVVEAALMVFVDRPVALYLHAHGAGIHPLFVSISAYGVGYPYLILSAAAYLALRWGGAVPALRSRAAAWRARAWVPLFVFAAIAGSGLLTDLIKVLCGRTRPKLLFAAGAYHFTGLSLRADHWSFPSGHATTIVALMTALWCLWPRYVAFYVLVAAIVAGARVVIGQHYPSDVVMGAAIAIFATLMLYRLFLRGGVDTGVLRPLPRDDVRPLPRGDVRPLPRRGRRV